MEILRRVALVTGGASGLGAATARMIVEAGGRVVIADLKAPEGGLGESAVYARTDVTDEESTAAAVRTARERFGRLDILVSCAGIATAQRILGKKGPMELAAFRKVIDINLVGAFNVSRLAAEAMAMNDGPERGVIVHTASVAAFDGQIGQCAYSASKGGVVGMTLPMARDLSRVGIRVVAIAPGMFDTPLLAALPAEAITALEKQVPFPPRLGRPSDYAQLVRQVIENEYLNGEVIRLDGALRMTP